MLVTDGCQLPICSSAVTKTLTGCQPMCFLVSLVCVSSWDVPQYLVDCCKSTTDVVSRQPAAPLCKSPSAYRATTSSHQVRPSGVCVAGPTAWNSLPDYLRDPPLSKDTFRRSLKTYVFGLCVRARSALEPLCNVLYKCSTYLLTVHQI